MRIECKYDEMMSLSELKSRIHPDNENKHSEDQIRSLSKVIAKIGIRHPIHISKLSGKIAGGHGRLMSFQKLGYDEAPIVWENFVDELEEINYRASDNIGQYAEFNNDLYVKNLEIAGVDVHEIDLEEFGVVDYEISDVSTELENNEEKYTRKVESPIYEPKGEMPSLSDIYDTKKYYELIKEIDASSLSESEKVFLRFAAARHIVFNYKNAAEYYAHASSEIQCLMENSALVIIDFEKAIERGFVQLHSKIREAYVR